MITYNDFLTGIDVISEFSFDEIVESLPDIDTNFIDYGAIYDLSSQNEIASVFIEAILEQWDWTTCEDVDFSSKSFRIVDVPSTKDLEEIVKVFSKWTILNYKQVFEQLKKDEDLEASNNEREQIINYLRDNASLEELRNFKLEIKYDQK